LFKQDSPENEKRMCFNLIILVAIYLSNNSGAENSTELFLSEAFHDLESTSSTIAYICSKGINLNATTVSYLICNTARPIHIHREVINLLRECMPMEEELMEHVAHSLTILLSNEDIGRIPIIDFLLTEFDVNDSIIESALISKDPSDVFQTIYGQNQHGMSEKLIMLLFSRYLVTISNKSDSDAVMHSPRRVSQIWLSVA
jgi:hypothetical protein